MKPPKAFLETMNDAELTMGKAARIIGMTLESIENPRETSKKIREAKLSQKDRITFDCLREKSRALATIAWADFRIANSDNEYGKARSLYFEGSQIVLNKNGISKKRGEK